DPAHMATGNVRTSSATNQNKDAISWMTVEIIPMRMSVALPALLRKADAVGKIPWLTILIGSWEVVPLKVFDLPGTTHLEM
ncbi:hypothetical protein NDU88_006400, partial [Pleurodeles waltl]